jgi:hypothetical protein
MSMVNGQDEPDSPEQLKAELGGVIATSGWSRRSLGRATRYGKTTISDAVNPSKRLPTQDVMRAILRLCQMPDEELPPWEDRLSKLRSVAADTPQGSGSQARFGGTGDFRRADSERVPARASIAEPSRPVVVAAPRSGEIQLRRLDGLPAEIRLIGVDRPSRGLRGRRGLAAAAVAVIGVLTALLLTGSFSRSAAGPSQYQDSPSVSEVCNRHYVVVATAADVYIPNGHGVFRREYAKRKDDNVIGPAAQTDPQWITVFLRGGGTGRMRRADLRDSGCEADL